MCVERKDQEYTLSIKSRSCLKSFTFLRKSVPGRTNTQLPRSGQSYQRKSGKLDKRFKFNKIVKTLRIRFNSTLLCQVILVANKADLVRNRQVKAAGRLALTFMLTIEL